VQPTRKLAADLHRYILFQSIIINYQTSLLLEGGESLNMAFLAGGIWKKEDFFLKS
jgi:hypothetical protein